MPRKFTRRYRKPVRRFVRKRRAFRRKRVSLNSRETTLTLPFRRNLQMYPDRYIVSGHTSFGTSVSQAGTIGTDQKWYFDMMANAICNGNGPSINGGGLGTNVPAGLYYLLGSQDKGAAHAGGNAPYLQYRVHQCAIKVTYIPDQAVATNCPAALVIVPMAYAENSGNLTSMTLSQLIEQPMAKVKYIPSTVNGNVRGCTCYNSQRTMRILGNRYKASDENGLLDGSYSTNPTVLWQWHVRLTTISASNTSYALYGHFQVELWYNIEFKNRNSYITTVPA